MLERSWIQILALYTGWTFFTLICCENCIVCLKRPKRMEKGDGIGPFFLKKPTYFSTTQLGLGRCSLTIDKEALKNFYLLPTKRSILKSITE